MPAILTPSSSSSAFLRHCLLSMAIAVCCAILTMSERANAAPISAMSDDQFDREDRDYRPLQFGKRETYRPLQFGKKSVYRPLQFGKRSAGASARRLLALPGAHFTLHQGGLDELDPTTSDEWELITLERRR